MPNLMPLTRRRFGIGLGALLGCAGTRRRSHAHDGVQETMVRIDNSTFEPLVVEIFAGDSVTWENNDLASHTATALDGSWDTGLLERGTQGRIIFTEPGEYPYVSTFRSHMKATVLVRNRDGG
ncbi:MAG: copper-binding protein [Roseovarius sp.]|nr:copper-binding protein [Roseovarius sp.]|tara:strand:- start:1345 stop:1713 length:369 start_codon:yes stop_codon:yes gene_type:complete